jgi:hypothetical protein
MHAQLDRSYFLVCQNVGWDWIARTKIATNKHLKYDQTIPLRRIEKYVLNGHALVVKVFVIGSQIFSRSTQPDLGAFHWSPDSAVFLNWTGLLILLLPVCSAPARWQHLSPE